MPGNSSSQIGDSGIIRERNEFVNSDELNLSEIKLVCRDERLRPFWIDLLSEKWIFAGQLQKEYDCSEMLRSTYVDLNDDGKNEIAISVKSACGSKGNCPFALYGIFDDERAYMRTSAGTFDFSRRKLLFSKAVMNYEVQDSKHFGYHDILLRFSSGLYGSYLELFRFDGESYQRAVCFDEDTDGEKSRTKCWEDED